MMKLERIDEAKQRATRAIRTHNLSGRENAELMADVAIDAAVPVLLGDVDLDAQMREAFGIIRWLSQTPDNPPGAWAYAAANAWLEHNQKFNDLTS